MTITSKTWGIFVSALRDINDTAANLVQKKWHELYPIDTDAKLQALLDYSYAVATKYGEAATALTASMYDWCAARAGVVLPSAEPAATATYDDVARTVVGTMNVSKSPEAIGASVARLVKMAGVDTTMQNALRDGAEWAWIPRGMTCAFCIMLASRGWTPASRDAIKGGHAEHIHANCDCTYAIRFDSSSNVAGYAPDEYREMYDSADGRTGRQKLNSMRREFYERNKEVINEQKRDAYAKREERNSSSAEETNIE